MNPAKSGWRCQSNLEPAGKDQTEVTQQSNFLLSQLMNSATIDRNPPTAKVLPIVPKSFPNQNAASPLSIAYDCYGNPVTNFTNTSLSIGFPDLHSNHYNTLGPTLRNPSVINTPLSTSERASLIYQQHENIYSYNAFPDYTHKINNNHGTLPKASTTLTKQNLYTHQQRHDNTFYAPYGTPNSSKHSTSNSCRHSGPHNRPVMGVQVSPAQIYAVDPRRRSIISATGTSLNSLPYGGQNQLLQPNDPYQIGYTNPLHHHQFNPVPPTSEIYNYSKKQNQLVVSKPYKESNSYGFRDSYTAMKSSYHSAYNQERQPIIYPPGYATISNDGAPTLPRRVADMNHWLNSISPYAGEQPRIHPEYYRSYLPAVPLPPIEDIDGPITANDEILGSVDMSSRMHKRNKKQISTDHVMNQPKGFVASNPIGPMMEETDTEQQRDLDNGRHPSELELDREINSANDTTYDHPPGAQKDMDASQTGFISHSNSGNLDTISKQMMLQMPRVRDFAEYGIHGKVTSNAVTEDNEPIGTTAEKHLQDLLRGESTAPK